MPLEQVFRDLFRDPAAERELSTLGRHISLPTFNLATTSLRHLSKWYDRLQSIAEGIVRDHPNYYSDPESLGLVRQANQGAVLSKAGELFLATKSALRNNAARAEYELVRVLYYSGIAHRARVNDFLMQKRQNLIRFLTDCHRTTNSSLLIGNPKLLAIAEVLTSFPGALYRFLKLRQQDLAALADLGESGFTRLWEENVPPAGLGRLGKKIGSDYTRAEERRLHVVMAMLLHEVRLDLTRRAKLFDHFTIPEPFANLVSEDDLVRLHGNYTDDVKIVMEAGGLAAFLSSEIATIVAPPTTTTIGLRTQGRRRSRRPSGGTQPREPVGRFRLIDAVVAKEAEDFVERTILGPRHGRDLVRVGHTALESTPLDDGAIPGADFYVRSVRRLAGIAFYDVKSSLSERPQSIQVTRAEYERATKCNAVGIPYELFVVGFQEGQATPRVYHIPDFAARMARLSMNDLIAFGLSLDFS